MTTRIVDSARYRNWFARLEAMHAGFDAGDFSKAEQAIAELQRDADDLALDGLDVREYARCLLQCEQAHVLIAARDYTAALAVLEAIKPSAVLPTNLHASVSGNIELQRGNTLITKGNPEGASDAYEAAFRHALLCGNFMLAAHAQFNLGGVMVGAGQFDRAYSALSLAKRYYGVIALPEKVAEADHALGNVWRLRGDLNAAFAHYQAALEVLQKTQNHASLWRLTDDIARLHLRRAGEDGEPPDEWLDLAFDFAIAALYHSEQVWAASRRQPKYLKDLSAQLVNATTTFVECSLSVGAIAAFVGALARAKDGVLSAEADALASVASPDEVLEHASRERHPAAFASALSKALLTMKGAEKIALVDHFVLRRKRVVLGAYFTEETQCQLDCFESAIEDDVSQEETISLRGEYRCDLVQNKAGQLLEVIGSHALRCAYALNLGADEMRIALQEWAKELDPLLSALGDAFFPEQLLDEIERRNISHVVLVPDRALPLLPYHALRARRGVVADQPWTLSIASSAFAIARLEARRRVPRVADSPILWVAPDRDVNDNRGGENEFTRLGRHFALERLSEDSATCEEVIDALHAGRWVHFRGHGRWTTDVTTSGPVVADGILDRRALERSARGVPGFLVTAACHTAFAEHVGTEPLGSVSDYDRAGALGAVLSL